ncbi:hypothetical protein AKJ09_01249 [Labilithrix luteola]|uniref:Uncharacterized protein n=1 Tax=Labilithrix luteola TaxID=1391654 RepID=A0A0K1PM33_9BACT|nr:hypothetical protein AKJ09_01249 [Labilithrix luteola]
MEYGRARAGLIEGEDEFDGERAEPSPPPSSPARPSPDEVLDETDDEEAEAYTDAPSTLRSPAPSRSPLLASSSAPSSSSPSPPVSLARHLKALAPIFGIGAGVLAAVVSLAGMPRPRCVCRSRSGRRSSSSSRTSCARGSEASRRRS